MSAAPHRGRGHRSGRRAIRAVAVACVALLSRPAGGAEIDSVTPRSAEIPDAGDYLETWINDRLRIGVERANESGEGCDEDELYEQVKKAFSSPFIGHSIAETLNAREDLPRARIRFEDSIYRDLAFLDAISVHLKDLSAVVRLDGHLVGVDKLGHFLVQGWKYFDVAYRDGGGVEAAMRWGEKTERTYFGFYTTGIYSYADLAVNFEGMRFWLRLRGQEKDPLRRGYFFNRSYVRCARILWRWRPRWKLRRKVRLADYATGAWDEGSNCSRYRSAEMERLIDGRVEEREVADSADYSCPVEPADCVRARERYGPFAHRLLSPACLAVEPARRPWWRFW